VQSICCTTTEEKEEEENDDDEAMAVHKTPCANLLRRRSYGST
jgi:hypothetical protein